MGELRLRYHGGSTEWKYSTLNVLLFKCSTNNRPLARSPFLRASSSLKEQCNSWQCESIGFSLLYWMVKIDCDLNIITYFELRSWTQLLHNLKGSCTLMMPNTFNVFDLIMGFFVKGFVLSLLLGPLLK